MEKVCSSRFNYRAIGANITRMDMISNNESSLSSLLLRKSIIHPGALLQTYHKNCMYTNEKSFHEVSTQSQPSSTNYTDEQTQVSEPNQSRDTQTCSINPSVSIKHSHRRINPSTTMIEHFFINPYSIIDRVNQGEEFLKFLSKQNLKLDFIYTHFLKHLQRYTDEFLLALQAEHGIYGIYRRDMIR